MLTHADDDALSAYKVCMHASKLQGGLGSLVLRLKQDGHGQLALIGPYGESASTQHTATGLHTKSSIKRLDIDILVMCMQCKLKR